jgi:class III cytochrome C family protein
MFKSSWYLLCLLSLGLIGACRDFHDQAPRVIDASTINFEFVAELGSLQRPLVEFPHAVHTQALEDEGCGACHATDPKGRLQTWLLPKEKANDLDQIMDFYHAACLGCHNGRLAKGKESGPVTCGECHVEARPGLSTRREMRFDYSLHARHSLAEQDNCKTCHREGNQSCSDCHKPKPSEGQFSLAQASHFRCINCHIAKLKANKPSGPQLCDACHDEQLQKEITLLAEVPRLKAKQPDVTWIKTEHGKSKLVAFNHKAHEVVSSSCHDCHHQTLKPCKECHTLTGTKQGGGVTLEQAYHSATSRLSCVGCHRQMTASDNCQGCHHMFADQSSGSTCRVCHSGPSPEMADSLTPQSATQPVELAALPGPSANFPEKIEIDLLADKYKAAQFPHRKIVAKLDSISRENKLAARFHAKTQTLCAGCHHRIPAGSRPPACSSCHDTKPLPARDKPDLKTAFHRQCLGCHQQMNLVQECDACHAEASQKEVPK